MNAKRRVRRARNQTKKLLGIILVLIIAIGLGLFVLTLNGKDKDAKTIMLDAGHGGDQSGIQALYSEDEFDEKVVDALYTLLDDSRHFKVVRTHEAGTAMSVADRIANINNNTNVDLVLSIHGNESENTAAKGALILVQPSTIENHEASVSLANCIQNEFSDLGIYSSIQYLYFDPILDGTIFQEKYVSVEDTTDYGLETIDIAYADAPVVQIRHLYLSNQEDVDYWTSEEGIQKAAKLYYDALSSFYQD